MKKTLKASDELRKCVFDNCNRTLSIYNHEKYCHLHLNWMSEEEKIRSSIHAGYPEPLHQK
jgi:hypothetical protein